MEKTTAISHKGKVLGRPRTRTEEAEFVQTRIPDALHDYLKAVSAFRYKTMANMFEAMFTRFINERPWERGLHFRQPKAAVKNNGTDAAARTGWSQLNIQLTQDMAAQVKEEAKKRDVSLASYCYSAIYWWCQYVYPPRKQ